MTQSRRWDREKTNNKREDRVRGGGGNRTRGREGGGGKGTSEEARFNYDEWGLTEVKLSWWCRVEMRVMKDLCGGVT